ncbi:interferon alpha-inducible protein 27-like protein 2A [Protopterus annectens]|uniref:interferon alpha-inducible protein 27-like protein 2A n=1 Tax=Protopterus annectens TaxID=7888 RepID=UPI001CF95161|nr:interferon alpha-inducible protein 27-like protein 2A [Protopterus annectens]XP_043940694.1 interferon alpha-inducible protein 27-like protein 2A [Protopterus annectens]
MIMKSTIFLIYLVASSLLVNGVESKKSGDSSWSSYIWMGAGAVAAVVAAPVALGAAGFTAAGIASGSLGASMMSVSAIANGGGVAAGGVVATLQSLGTGLGMTAYAVTTAAGTAGGYAAKKIFEDED